MVRPPPHSPRPTKSLWTSQPLLTGLLAIGADYPLSAVICSEFAPRKHRARMLASVFLCQPIGQLLGMLVSLVVMTISSDRLPRDSEICQTDECIRTVDSAWRSIVGFGSVPALVALFFRLTIPESPRYLLDVVGAVKSASEETQVYYGGDSFDNQSQEMMEAGRHFNDAFIEHQLPKYSSEGTPSASPTINRLSDGERHDPIRSPVLHVQVPLADVRAVVNPPSPAHTFGSEHLSHHPSRPVTIRAETLPPQPEPAEPAFWNDQQPPKASWQDAHDYFIKQKNWIYLVGTASTWFWLDVSRNALLYISDKSQ